MKSSQISAQIRQRDAQIDDVQAQIDRVRQQISDLGEFRQRHQTATTQVDQDLTARRAQVNGAAIDATRVRSFARYQEAMIGILNDGYAYLTTRNEEALAIGRAIYRKQEELDGLLRDRGNLQLAMTELQDDLRAAKAAEAAATKY
ncbi:MAG: hypothetical protein LBV06_08645 [Propionibacteriaceae bacterium]|jgi:chromosome segregation ATPase|nr:hypothetical protein [Propionibacteriaceae bacterium]